MMLKDKGEVDEAEELLRRELAILEMAHGQHHMETINCQENFWRVQILRGDGEVVVGLADVEKALGAL